MLVRLRVEAARLPCVGQTLRARAGDSLAAPLLASWDGGSPTSIAVASFDRMDQNNSSDSHEIVEVVGGRHILLDLRTDDGGGELCAGGFIAHAQQMAPIHNASAAWYSGAAGDSWWTQLGAARATALALAVAVAAAALLLAAHSAHRTRLYQRAADKDMLTDSDACSASLELLSGVERGSRSTLLSELAPARPGVSLRRLLRSRVAHRRLIQSTVETAQVETDIMSAASSSTITPEDVCNSAHSAPAQTNRAQQSPQKSPPPRPNTALGANQASQIEHEVTSPGPPPSVVSETATTEFTTSMSSVSRDCERDSYSEKDRDSVAEKERCTSVTVSSRTSSAATLTNGNYSPALSGVYAARVRGQAKNDKELGSTQPGREFANPKHGKESSNRRRVLRASDLSLTSNAQEMEMDYYDYEVNNAGSAPGSYLGMDPAFLVWIPPLEEGDIIQEIDEKSALLYEDTISNAPLPDPGSNKESPEFDKPEKYIYTDNKISATPSPLLIKKTVIHPLNFSISDLQKDSPKLHRSNSNKNKPAISIMVKNLSENNVIKEVSDNKPRTPVPVHRKTADKSEHEETNRIKKLSNSADVKFADENSDSSDEIKFMDDDTPDSNKLIEEIQS